MNNPAASNGVLIVNNQTTELVYASFTQQAAGNLTQRE